MWACNAFCSSTEYHYLSISGIFLNKYRNEFSFFFGNVMLCRTATIYRRFGRLWRRHLQSSNKRMVLLWQLVLEVLGINIILNIDSHLPSDKAVTTHMTVLFSNLVMRRTYQGCLESIQPIWISREPVMWFWCNLAASQRRLYCAFVNSHSPVGLVSRQWDAVDWVCVLCDRRIHKSPPLQRRF